MRSIAESAARALHRMRCAVCDFLAPGLENQDRRIILTRESHPKSHPLQDVRWSAMLGSVP